jgi:hypothetical protein
VKITDEMRRAVSREIGSFFAPNECDNVIAAVAPLMIAECATFVRNHPAITFDDVADEVAADMRKSLSRPVSEREDGQ